MTADRGRQASPHNSDKNLCGAQGVLSAAEYTAPLASCRRNQLLSTSTDEWSPCQLLLQPLLTMTCRYIELTRDQTAESYPLYVNLDRAVGQSCRVDLIKGLTSCVDSNLAYISRTALITVKARNQSFEHLLRPKRYSKPATRPCN